MDKGSNSENLEVSGNLSKRSTKWTYSLNTNTYSFFQSIDTCTNCAEEMGKTADTLTQIKTVAPNKLVAV